MGFISIFIFLFKYGPSIFQLIKSAVELIRWLKKNDEPQNVTSFAEEDPVKERLHGMARRAKVSKDQSELKDFVSRLEHRKAEVLKRRGK